MDKNYGVYICKGCGIGDVVDVDGVIKESGRYDHKSLEEGVAPMSTYSKTPRTEKMKKSLL